MNVTGQTLLLIKEGSSNHQTIRHRIFPCGGLHTCCICRVIILLSAQCLSHREYFFPKGLVFGFFFFATFDLANGTKQRTFPTYNCFHPATSREKKNGCGKLSGFAGKKTKKQQQKQFHQYSDRRLSVM
jgi:hypothetical protein